MTCGTLCIALAGSAYLIFACMPLFVRWRRGLAISIAFTVAMLVPLMLASWFLIVFVVPRSACECGDVEEALLFSFFPAGAMLVGAGLAACWSVIAACKRLIRREDNP